MAESKFSKEEVGDEVPGNQAFAVSGRRLDKRCQPCSTADMWTKAEYWGVDCSEYLCSACSKTHKRFAIAMDHRIVVAGEADKVSASYDMKGLDQCNKHSKLLEFVCEDEDILCCSTCAFAKHRKCHNVVEIKTKATARSTDLDSIKSDLLDIESKAKAYDQRLMNTREKVTTKATDITNKIQEMQDKVNKMFESLKMNVAKEILSFQQQAFQDLDQKNNVLISNITDVSEALSDVENVRQQGTPSQQLIMAHYLKDKVITLEAKVDQDISDLKDINMSFNFDKSIKLPPTKNISPGKLTMKYVPYDVTEHNDRLGLKSKDKNQTVKLMMIASLDLKQGDGDVEEPFYIGLDFLPDGRIVAVDYYNKKCLVYNHKLGRVGGVLLPTKPFGVTVMTDEMVAVSCCRAIYFINISKSNEVKVTRSLKVTMNCFSICMMTDDSFLVGCYNDPQPVRVVSVKGEERMLAINFPSKQYRFDAIDCAYIKNRNKIVISDRYAHTIYIYDIANNTKWEVKDGTIIKEPRGVAVGHADCIIVCSIRTKSVVLISHIGHILSSYALDLRYPHSVCVSKDNTRIAVSNDCSKMKKLQLLNIELVQ